MVPIQELSLHNLGNLGVQMGTGESNMARVLEDDTATAEAMTITASYKSSNKANYARTAAMKQLHQQQERHQQQ